MTEDGVKKSVLQKRFLVCSWNVRVDTQWVNDREHDPMQEAVRTLLNAAGAGEVARQEGENDADIVAVLPRNQDRPLSIHDLRFYAYGLGGKPKKVLYVHSGHPSTFAEGRINAWLFIAQRASCSFQEVPAWLDEEMSQEHPEVGDRPRRQGIRAAARARFEIRQRWQVLKARRADLPEAERRELTRSGEALLEDSFAGKSAVNEHLGKSPARFFFALCRLSNAYDHVEHDVNARKAHGRRTSVETLYDDACMKLLNSCVDLRAALAARYQALCQLDTSRKVILLIDDNPTRGDFQSKVLEYVESFLPGIEMWVWNPDAVPVKTGGGGDQKRGSWLSRKDVEEYSSWKQPDVDDFLERQLNVQEEDGQPRPKSLQDVLARTHVMLVDILFQDARGREHEAGYGIVRGLQRIFRDVQRKMSENRAWHIPEVLAVSRASDIEKVHTVYRTGAAGYVLKDRPLSIPGAVARTFQPAIEDVHAAHRNFRALYNLPHATVGAIRATCIPPIPFHQPPHSRDGTDTKELRERSDEIKAAQSLAKLLAMLPKADLHVHPGTCMKPEFLVVASLVMLVRHDLGPKAREVIRDLAKAFGGSSLTLQRCPVVDAKTSPKTISFSGYPGKLAEISESLRDFLIAQVQVGDANRQFSSKLNVEMEKRYRELRSLLHAEFKIADHIRADEVCRALRGLPDAECFFFALRHSNGSWNTREVFRNQKNKKLADDKDDLLRLYLLWLAGDNKAYPSSNIVATTPSSADDRGCKKTTVNIAKWFRCGEIDFHMWTTLRTAFYGDKDIPAPTCSKNGLESANWALTAYEAHEPRIEVSLGVSEVDAGFLADCPDVDEHPIAWLVASGTRSSNLREYLEGSDYTGSEHLKHPFLMHLFAQQAVYEFIRHGVLYAELRTALSGYTNPHLDISFSNASSCFCAAMSQAQELAEQAYVRRKPRTKTQKNVPVWLWGNCFVIEDLFDPVKDELALYRFPCKTSIVLTGKRDKPSRVLLREAGAGAVLHARPIHPAHCAMEFVQKAVRECRVVGFDLAGQEDNHPPRLFREEYLQIARMHIPVTAHAGENAPSDFVESAILDLRARRIGHGLALADDKALMDRARDDGTCIELCPVSNFQTNAVHPNGHAETGREYPLAKFLKEGLIVTINTDNPVVSYTNMVKECFQAAYAFGTKQLSLWDLLRILRAGFTQAFLTQPERRALLELTDQIVFDLFSRTEIVNMLSMTPTSLPTPRPDRCDL